MTKCERSTERGMYGEGPGPWMVTPTSGIARASSAIARPIIHGGRSLITYSLATAELELTTDEVPLPQVGQLSCTTSYLQCHMHLYSCGRRHY